MAGMGWDGGWAGRKKWVGRRSRGTYVGTSVHNSLQPGKNWGESLTVSGRIREPEYLSSGVQGRLNGGGSCLVFWSPTFYYYYYFTGYDPVLKR